MFFNVIRFLCAGFFLLFSTTTIAQANRCAPPERACGGGCYDQKYTECYTGLNPFDYPTGSIICSKNERPCGGGCYNITYGKTCRTDLPRNLYPRGSIACNGDEVPCKGGCAKASQCTTAASITPQNPGTQITPQNPDTRFTGNWFFSFILNGASYEYELVINSPTHEAGITGHAGYPAGKKHAQEWSLTGKTNGDHLSFTAKYTLGAVGTTMKVDATMESDGSLSGNWSDDYNGQRQGTLTARRAR